MAEVVARVVYWTPQGMREHVSTTSSTTGYVELREVERLLEEAHRRGWESCSRDTEEKLKLMIRTRGQSL